ncbi:MAG: 30S ribosomal protein S5 [bacterium]
MAKKLQDRVVYINRVSKAVAGGSNFGFSTMVAVGDEDGRVGIGIGKAKEVPASINKGRAEAEKTMIEVPRLNKTIPYAVEGRHDAAHVLLKPASPGTGVIAGGAVRALVELAGIKDILTKSLGSDNPLNIARATMNAIKKIRSPHEIANLRGISVDELLKDNPFGGLSADEVDAKQEKEEAEEARKAEEASAKEAEVEIEAAASAPTEEEPEKEEVSAVEPT